MFRTPSLRGDGAPRRPHIPDTARDHALHPRRHRSVHAATRRTARPTAHAPQSRTCSVRPHPVPGGTSCTEADSHHSAPRGAVRAAAPARPARRTAAGRGTPRSPLAGATPAARNTTHRRRPRTSSRSPSPRATPRWASPCRSPSSRTAPCCTPRATAHCASPTPRGNTKVAGTLPVYTHDEEGLQGVGVDPGLHRQPLHLPLLRAPARTPRPATRPETGTAADFAPFDGVNRLSRFVLKADGTLDTGQREEDPRRAGLPRHVLPRRRRHRLRRGGQPLPVHRRRHQPLRLRRLHAHRRARRPQPGLRRPAFRGQHQRPARQDPAHQGRTPTARTPSRPATSSRPAPTRPGPRSTRWASATPSG